MAKMERKRTLTMNWDHLGDDDDDAFFDTYNRTSTASPDDLDSDDDDDFEDSRMSFSSAASFRHDDFRKSVNFRNSIRRDDFRPSTNYRPPSIRRDDFSIKFRSSIRRDDFQTYNVTSNGLSPNYDIWMAAPGSIRERRKKLFAGMGLDSNKQLLKDNSIMFSRRITRKLSNMPVFAPPATATATASASPAAGVPPKAPKPSKVEGHASSLPPTSAPPPPPEDSSQSEPEESPSQPHTPPSQGPIELVRSRSDGDIDIETHDTAKRRKEELLGPVSKQRLKRTYSEIVMSHARIIPYSEALRIVAAPAMSSSPTKRKNGHKASLSSVVSNNRFGAFFLIKDLDTGKEFIVNEFDQNGMWNKFSDLETGKKLTAEEFEKSVGFSPVVKELMRRENKAHDNRSKFAANSYISRSIKLSKQRGAALLKNLSTNFKGSMKLGEKESQQLAPASPAPGDPKGNKNTSSWIKVRQSGKTHKDLSALHLCQEIQAHEGSIWTMKFNLDGRYLASAGEDKTIHIWEVQECEIMSSKLPEDWNTTPLHPSASNSPAHPNLGDAQQMPSNKKKKGKAVLANKKGSSVPDYAHVPETVFALSEKPICSFHGHTDDVLDLSWSKSQLLLSSSMDKTVRLWDLETKSCVKTFVHSDYVTCIHFNPIDDNIFISGSLDEKVRMWNIRTRRLVAYFDVYEMVTAVCYSPDGKEALVGTHKGNCRVFAAEDCKLEEKIVIETQKKKPQIKKITGFHFAPGNPSEVLITSADSRIRIFEGEDVVHKFIGFRNTSSQIAAWFSNDAKYVISASEDSQVYVWRREEPPTKGAGKGTAAGKAKTRIITQSYEHFTGKDISVAIPWPASPKYEPPASAVELPTKKHRKRSSNLPAAVTEENAPSPARKTKPPRPKKGSTNTTTPAAASSSPDKDKEASESSREEEGGDAQVSGSDSGAGESSQHSEPAPKNASWAPSWAPSWMDSGGDKDKNKEKDQDRVTAWGLVIVTAGLGGEIRAYQNFGLPRRIGGLPTTLF